MSSEFDRFQLAAHASELCITASWEKAAGKSLLAAQHYLAAAALWRDAAEALRSHSSTEATRQLMNRVFAFVEAGDFGQANRAIAEVDRELFFLEAPSDVRTGLETEWRDMLQRIEPARRRFREDWEELRKESRGAGDSWGPSGELASRWIDRYPGLAHAHYLAFRAAEAAEDWCAARRHLDFARQLAPDNSIYPALHLNLLPYTEPLPRIAGLAHDIYHRFKTKSARVSMMYAMLMLELGQRAAVPRREAWESAALAFEGAIDDDTGELPFAFWSWAHVLSQYCRWRLEEAGIGHPFREHWFARGEEIFLIDLTKAEPGNRGEAALTSDAAEADLLREALSVA